MKELWKRWRARLNVEAKLRASRPEPQPDFLHSLAERVREDDRRRPARFRLAFAGGLTAAMLVGVASVGGFGYAATAAKEAFKGVRTILASSDSSRSIEVRGLNAGGDQYQPGYSWGDPNHNHAGPPGLVRKGGEFAPPFLAECGGATARVTAPIVLDEQAVLRVSALGPDGKKLLLTQKGSRIGGELSGPQTKTIRYRALIPRVIRISLRIPCNLLEDGKTYRILITATDPGGETSTLAIPFRAVTGTA